MDLIREDGLKLLVWLVACVLILPFASVFAQTFTLYFDIFKHLYETVLYTYVVNTFFLGLWTVVGVFVIGVSCAWIVSMYSFPFKRVLEWALVLPFAVPSYILAYVYTDFFQITGPVQSWLREITEWEVKDYYFPNIRSLGGAVIILILAFYPYVYMMARAAFLHQSACAFEVSRTLGLGPWKRFFRVALPLARPGIVVGLALVLMEVLNDFGTVQYFSVDTFTTGIYRTWFGLGSKEGAAQLSVLLLTFVFMLVSLEKYSRKQLRFHNPSSRHRQVVPQPLSRYQSWGAITVCALPVVFGFIAPGVLLILQLKDSGWKAIDFRFFAIAGNSFTLAFVAAILCVCLGFFLAFARRLFSNKWKYKSILGVVSMGYAIPGSVLAVGVLTPLGKIDEGLDWFFQTFFQRSSLFFVSGTIFALIYAYLVRFLSIPFEGIEAGLRKISPSTEAAAKVLGAGPWAVLCKIHFPLLKGSLVSALLLVFVDVLKELPATMILSPFNFETLAVHTYNLASDERLSEASPFALLIVLVGVIPVFYLNFLLSKPQHARESQRENG